MFRVQGREMVFGPQHRKDTGPLPKKGEKNRKMIPCSLYRRFV